MVSFYNGVRMTSEEAELNKDDWTANAYKILDLQGWPSNLLRSKVQYRYML